MKCQCLHCRVNNYCSDGQRERAEEFAAAQASPHHFVLWAGCSCGAGWDDDFDCCPTQVAKKLALAELKRAACGTYDF